MQLGMIGLGRMGGSMVRRLLKGGHTCVVCDSAAASVTQSTQDGAEGAHSLDDLVTRLDSPRAIWLDGPRRQLRDALMAAYSEGFNILAHANAGAHPPSVDAETAPLRHPDLYRYDIALPDVAEVWRRGSVIGSWLLDLTARALTEHPDFKQFSGRVSDSGEGRWTANAAIDTSTPAPALTAALFQRFSSRGEDDLSDRLHSAMRFQFGGHLERPAEK